MFLEKKTYVTYWRSCLTQTVMVCILQAAVESTAPPRPKPVPPPLIPAQNEPKPVTRIAYLNVAATPIPHPEIPVAPTVPPDPARKQLERHLDTMFKALGKRPSERRKRG